MHGRALTTVCRRCRSRHAYGGVTERRECLFCGCVAFPSDASRYWRSHEFAEAESRASSRPIVRR